MESRSAKKQGDSGLLQDPGTEEQDESNIGGDERPKFTDSRVKNAGGFFGAPQLGENGRALVKPKNMGQFDPNHVQFSYIDPKLAAENAKKERMKKANEPRQKTLESQEEFMLMDAKQKMVKKSKDMILEMPEYFTQEELIEQFGRKKKDQ